MNAAAQVSGAYQRHCKIIPNLYVLKVKGKLVCKLRKLAAKQADLNLDKVAGSKPGVANEVKGATGRLGAPQAGTELRQGEVSSDLFLSCFL